MIFAIAMCNSLDQQFPGVFHFENDQAYKHAKERDLIIREDREGRIVLKGKEQKHEALQRHSDTLTVPCPALPCHIHTCFVIPTRW